MGASIAAPAASQAGPPAPSPARALAQMVVGNQVQQAIYVAAKLGIADALDGESMAVEDLAEATDAHPDALLRLMRALAGLGIFALEGERRFSLTPMGALLRGDHPQSVRSFALWSGGVSYQAFGGLEQSVRTGAPAFERIFGMEFFDYLSSHPESGAVFDEMMSRHTAPIAPVIAGHGLGAVETIVDVGGGRGGLLAALLTKHPGLHGILFEQPRLCAAAARTLREAGVEGRCEIIAGDIFESLPTADAYILKSLIHGLADDDAVRVLENCGRAMRPGGMVLLVEMLMPTGNAPAPARLMDLLMLVGCHGRERTEAEFSELLAAAGLTVAAITATKHAYAVIEAHKAATTG